jgi:hypothetical protein
MFGRVLLHSIQDFTLSYTSVASTSEVCMGSRLLLLGIDRLTGVNVE